MADKYTQDDRDDMAKSGEAMSDGSYPIKDEEDLKNAIHAVGRGGADHDAIRKHIMDRAKVLELSNLIPENWEPDGSIKDADEAKGRDVVPAVAMRADYRNVPETRVSTGPQFELREVQNGTGGTNLKFTGFASVTGDEAAYEMEDFLGPWTESINAGAFKRTLDNDADVAFLLNHGGMTLARTKPGTLKLSEETDGYKSPIYGVTGLHSEAMLDPTNMYVQAMRSAVERGDLDEMSFAFRVMRQEWNSDYSRRWINEVSLDKGDVSLVNYGANPTTGGTVAMRQRFNKRSEPMDFRRLVFRMTELRLGKTLSSDTIGSLQEVLDLIDTSDTNVDEALIKLSGLMGVVNPDIAQDAALERGFAGGYVVNVYAQPGGDARDIADAVGFALRAVDTGCECCEACGPMCDGTCCDDCDMGGEAAESLARPPLNPLGFLSLPDYTTSARARMAIARSSR